MKHTKFLIFFLGLVLAYSCKKNDYDIDYQDNYPTVLAGNWVAFEFQGGSIDGRMSEPYDLVTSLDPNHDGFIILDKLYSSDIRVRANFDSTLFHIIMGEQLEQIGTNTYNIAYISVDGYVSSDPILINVSYQLASSFYENLSFDESDIKEVIFMHAGYYDKFKFPVDTVLIIGYRKTGFEEVDY